MDKTPLDRPELVIRNGLIADGLGSPLVVGDIAVRGGVISAVGEVAEKGVDEIDARGLLVTPGFVDVHTHYDGQAVWSDRFAPSSSHGVTTVVMGNCGVGFAPCRTEDHDLLVSVMEGVEDIPELVMTEGLDWTWETFPQFMDAIEARPHDIDYAAYLPHSPLRVYTMGERGAARELATPDDLAKMESLVVGALNAGALGFATSSITAHRTGEGEFIPSFQAEEAELQAVARAIRKTGKGVIQMVLDQRRPSDAFVPMLKRLSQSSGATVTFTMTEMSDHPELWRDALAAVHDANKEAGVTIRPQVFPRPMGMLLGLDLTLNPFSLCESYQPLLELTLDERAKALRDPALRARLMTEEPSDPYNPLFVIARDFERLYAFRTPADYEPDPATNLAVQSRATGRPALEIAYDLLLENDGRGMILATLTNYQTRSLEPVREMITHSDTIVGLGDGGAHYGLICDASFPTFLLTHWTRDRKDGRLSVPEAVRALTSKPANLVGLQDRGVIAPGYKADLNVIAYDRLQLKMPTVKYDLPSGGRRLDQAAQGYVATIVSGRVTRRDDQPTDELPGRLVRGQKAKPVARILAEA